MKIRFLQALALTFLLCLSAAAQNSIPQAAHLRIIKAEDERRFDKDLQDLLKSTDANIRRSAALASGRIGNDAAVAPLIELLEKDADLSVRTMAAFALGEIESAKAADAILRVLQNEKENETVRARAVEAAGKIAPRSKAEQKTALGEAILAALADEFIKPDRSREIVMAGLTAALRARPKDGETTVAKFLSDKDARIRADAANTLSRIRAKNESINAQLRAVLSSDEDAVSRATAARALGASEDKTAFDLLLKAATADEDNRVRVTAIRSLVALKDQKAAEPLLAQGEKLLAAYKTAKAKTPTPAEKNELLEIAATLGRLLQNSNDERAIRFLREFRTVEKFHSPEIEIAFARVSPASYLKEESLIKISYDAPKNKTTADWRAVSSVAQGLGEIATLENNEQNQQLRAQSALALFTVIENPFDMKDYDAALAPAMPEILRAYATFKTSDLPELLRKKLTHKDAYVRAAVAGLLGEQPASKENIEALKKAFNMALLTDKHENDAQLAIIEALYKLDKKEAVSVLLTALTAPDYLVRQEAFVHLAEEGIIKDFPGIPTTLESARAKGKDRVLPYSPVFGTKLGQILNTNADYVRAISRKNGQSRAILTTEKGSFAIEFFPEEAPLTVDNFIKLAKAGYFNGLTVHRVVPNFVMQDGDPRGDGNGGPGWSIRCEINMIPYERGMIGMALSGKDTGGSQWFATHSPQPHLDGGYTVFGRVNESDMKIVDSIARGDKILNVKIIEGNVSRQGAKTQRKTR